MNNSSLVSKLKFGTKLHCTPIKYSFRQVWYFLKKYTKLQNSKSLLSLCYTGLNQVWYQSKNSIKKIEVWYHTKLAYLLAPWPILKFSMYLTYYLRNRELRVLYLHVIGILELNFSSSTFINKLKNLNNET